MIRYFARDLKLPQALLMPLSPVARGILKRWEDAAVEYTECVEHEFGGRVLRTIFLIHNYSNSAIYSMAERLLKRIGVGKSAMQGDDDVDFAWVLLGGVLNDFADQAGVSRAATDELLEFRLRNSDYRTVTTWFEDRVEIANLKTGRVENLSLPPGDIDRIVDFALEFHNKKCAVRYEMTDDESADFVEFKSLMERYGQLVNRAGKS